MRPGMTTRLLICALTVCGFIQAQANAYSGGEGTRGEPYILSCKEDILELASCPTDFDKSFILTQDIDMEGAVFEGPVIAPHTVILPNFGEYECLFTGDFNGNGRVIENFSIVGEEPLGFFGGIGWRGRVMHLGLKNVSIEGPHAPNIGVLAAVNTGDIVGCFTLGNVTGNGNVGGLVGYQLLGRVFDCFALGRAEATTGPVGGLVGVLWEGEIHRCYSASTVICRNPSSGGGLVGMPVSGGRGSPPRVVSNSFWDVEVSGQSRSGGGVGLSTEQMHCLSTYVDAEWDFTAEQRNGINDIWTTSDEGGYPTLSAFSGVEPVWLAGGGTRDDPHRVLTARELAATGYYDAGRYFNLEGDIDLSGIECSVPIVAEFKGHLDGCGHHVRGFHQDGSCGLFGRIENGSTVADLHLEDADVKAGDDLVGCLASENHGRITTCSVTGVIRGGTVTGGLVGFNRGEIVKCSFSGTGMGDQQAGGLVGMNNGTIVSSVSRGAVTGEDEAGGLVGSNRGFVRSCYSIASVVGYSSLGGLVGANSGVVRDCYAKGPVTGAYLIGGLIGANSHYVSRCYSAGAVVGLHNLGGLLGYDDPDTGATSDSFWDMDVSGIETSAGGVGIESDRMRDVNTFLEAGWDFVEETANGTEDLWTIGDDGYPDLTLSLILPSRPTR